MIIFTKKIKKEDCQFIDHVVVWDGGGYACTRCQKLFSVECVKNYKDRKTRTSCNK